MIDVHKRVHAAKAAMGFKGGDPIGPVARDLANDACVLCFDEFQVKGLFISSGYDKILILSGWVG
jgi:predicted ATPase